MKNNDITDQTDELEENENIIDNNEQVHEYRKQTQKPHLKELKQNNSDVVRLNCNITEFLLPDVFHDYVQEMLRELRVDLY